MILRKNVAVQQLFTKFAAVSTVSTKRLGNPPKNVSWRWIWTSVSDPWISLENTCGLLVLMISMDILLPGWQVFQHIQDILVGGLEHFLFSHILGIIVPIDSYFSEGFKPPTSIEDFIFFCSESVHAAKICSLIESLFQRETQRPGLGEGETRSPADPGNSGAARRRWAGLCRGARMHRGCRCLFHSRGGTPKWMGYKGQSYENLDDVGLPPISGNLQMDWIGWASNVRRYIQWIFQPLT